MNKLKYLKRKNNIPILVFSLAVLLFYVLFSKVILKSDDGHFIGILSESGYNVFDWLKYRYNNISGRSICEFLTMEFLSLNSVFVKIFLSALWIFFVYIVQKTASAFGKNKIDSDVFVCCMPFTVLLTCLNSGAVWYSGAFTYLVPAVSAIIALSPLIFDLLKIKYKKLAYVPLSFICAFVSCSQEQASALTVTFLLVFIAALVLEKRIKPYHFLPLLSAVTETFFLFCSPGMRERTDMEAGSFEMFNSMNFFQKLLCGFSNYFAYEFLISLFVSGLFVFLLACNLNRLYGRKNKMNRLLAVLWVTVCIVANGIYIVFNKTIPDKGFEKSFKEGALNFFDIALISLGFVTVICLVAAVVMLAKKEFKTGFAVLLCFSAGVCSGTVLGFGSSIYSSGQRVFFFSEILMLIACAIMFAALENLKLKKNILKTVFCFSFVMYLTDCLSFAFMETPIMG